MMPNSSLQNSLQANNSLGDVMVSLYWISVLDSEGLYSTCMGFLGNDACMYYKKFGGHEVVHFAHHLCAYGGAEHF